MRLERYLACFVVKLSRDSHSRSAFAHYWLEQQPFEVQVFLFDFCKYGAQCLDVVLFYRLRKNQGWRCTLI